MTQHNYKVKHLEQIRYFSFGLYLIRFILRTDCFLVDNGNTSVRKNAAKDTAPVLRQFYFISHSGRESEMGNIALGAT